MHNNIRISDAKSDGPKTNGGVKTSEDTHREKFIQKHDNIKRINNMIIHGAKEQTVRTTSMKWHNDMVLAHNICWTVIERSWEFKKIYRIGKEEVGKCRPLKVIFKTADEKQQIMENLNKLKNVSEYKDIFITHDYTRVERDLIREWVEKAKKKSEKCAVSIWKVRGNPKEGLYLKRIFTRKRREERKDDDQINNPTSTHEGVQERAIHRGNTMPVNLYS